MIFSHIYISCIKPVSINTLHCIHYSLVYFIKYYVSVLWSLEHIIYIIPNNMAVIIDVISRFDCSAAAVYYFVLYDVDNTHCSYQNHEKCSYLQQPWILITLIIGSLVESFFFCKCVCVCVYVCAWTCRLPSNVCVDVFVSVCASLFFFRFAHFGRLFVSRMTLLL